MYFKDYNPNTPDLSTWIQMASS